MGDDFFEWLRLPEFTWFNLLIAVIILFVIYMLLKLARRLLLLWVADSEDIRYVLTAVMTTYEPVALILICTIFIFINPIFHSWIVLLSFIVGFSSIRNYIAGRLVYIDSKLSSGKRIKNKNTDGVIIRLGNLGLHLRTAEGIYYMTYLQLQRDGYVMVEDEDKGGFHQLELQPKSTENNHRNYIEELNDLLAMSPYLDSRRHPMLHQKEDSINVEFLLKKAIPLQDFVQLIEEWGYHCKVVQ